jgi:hypothetical protein
MFDWRENAIDRFPQEPVEFLQIIFAKVIEGSAPKSVSEYLSPNAIVPLPSREGVRG